MVTVTGLKNVITDFVRENPLITAIGVGTGVAGGAVATAAIVKSVRKKSKKKKKTTKRKTTKRRTTKRKPKKRKYKYARTAGKGKDRSTRRIRMTKNGQPYVILRSGKARFIKKSSARNSRKRKGGRY